MLRIQMKQKHEKIGLEEYDEKPNAFMKYSSSTQDVYKNIEKGNPQSWS